MIVIMRADATDAHLDQVAHVLRERGLTPHISRGVERTVVGVVGAMSGVGAAGGITPELGAFLAGLSGVESVLPVTRGYRLARREAQAARTQVRVSTPRGTVCVGGPEVVIMAGPCAVESEAQLLAAAHAARAGGATLLRGGAYKPSTSPYSFRGLGEAGLELLARARAATGLGVVTEVLSVETVAQVSACADLLQVGARNMANAPLLEAVGRSGKPVLLKRGWAATIEEWLLAAEYILATGNGQVVLCERGIRTFEPLTRNTLDINAIPLLKELSHLPVVVDPSQGTGRRSLVGAVTLAGVAAGADGVLLEIHPEPEAALKDGAQSLGLAAYAALMPQVRAVALALGRPLAGS